MKDKNGERQAPLLFKLEAKMKTKFRVRDKNMHFMCTEAEKQMIRERAELSGQPDLGSYLRRMAINGYVINVNYAELKELVYEINKIGTNINQIAHHINSDHIVYQTDIYSIQEDVNHIWQLLRSKLLHIEDNAVN